MGSRGPKILRRTTNIVLDALLKAAQTAYHGKPMGFDALHGIVENLKNAGTFDDFYRRTYSELVEVVELDKLEQKRTNAFGRLMVHPLAPLFDDGVLDRAILPNVFSFLHLVLGEDAQRMGEQCNEIVTALRDELEDNFSWDDFYDSLPAKKILWQTLTRVAGSFKRWDLRKDWFIKLMQYTPTTVSLGQNAFVTRAHDPHEERRVFSEREFTLFFQALFTPLVNITPADEHRFREEFGSDPHRLIGPFLVHLAACPT